MNIDADLPSDLGQRVRSQPARAVVALAVILFAVFAADVLLLERDVAPGLLMSRVVGTILILGFLWLIGAPLRAVGLRRTHLTAAMVVGGSTLLLLYALLYATEAGRLAAAGSGSHLVIGAFDANNEVRGPSFTAIFVTATLLNSFLEEGLFRGIMLPLFMRRMSFWKANALQAALFALWHLPIALEGWIRGGESATEALIGGAELFVATGTAGLVFGYLYYRTGSLWAPWLAHTIDNLVLNVFHLQVSSGALVESEIALLASLIGYPLLVVAVWVVANRFHLPRLQPWVIEARNERSSPTLVRRRRGVTHHSVPADPHRKRRSATKESQ